MRRSALTVVFVLVVGSGSACSDVCSDATAECRVVELPQLDTRQGTNFRCTSGTAINADGVVAGTTCDERAFLWYPDGSVVFLEFPPEMQSVAVSGLNGAGDLVGSFAAIEQGDRVDHAYTFSDGEVSRLPELDGQLLATPADLNDEGVAVGMSQTEDLLAVYWRDGEIRPLPVEELGGYSHDAQAINADGTIVGHTYIVGDDSHRVFRWSPSGSADLLSLPAGAKGATVADINDAGVVAGSVILRDRFVPAYWDSDGILHQLTSILGNVNHPSMAINNRGVIVANESSVSVDGSREFAALLWVDDEVYRLEELVPYLPGEYEIENVGPINDNNELVVHARVIGSEPAQRVTLVVRLDVD